MQQTIHSEAPEGNDFDRSKFYIFLNECLVPLPEMVEVLGARHQARERL